MNTYINSLPIAMRTIPAPLIPVGQPARRHWDGVSAVFLAFAAGLLLGVPLTLCALYISTIHEISSLPIDNRPLREALFPQGDPQTIRIADGQPPAASRLTNSIRKSGLWTGRASTSRGNVIPFHASDFSAAPGGGDVLNDGAHQVLLPFETLVDGVYWSELSEAFVPHGFDDASVVQWRKFLNNTLVLRVEEGCGRMQNRLVTLSGGDRACARYRHNSDQIQGEIFSFYLGRLLGLDNLLPSALALPDPHSGRWSSVASQISLARWSPGHPAVLTRFVDHLHPVFVPHQLQKSSNRRLHPVREDLTNLTGPAVSQLVQWSDLVLFDYLTANLDRVVNNMYNERWNPGMMSQPAHNLARTSDGLLVFLDNESGLLHGYRLLDKYESFHSSLLDALCIFRQRTVLALEKLHREDNVDVLLRRTFAEGDPGMPDWLPFLPDNSLRTLKERIARVLRQVRTCRTRFSTDL